MKVPWFIAAIVLVVATIITGFNHPAISVLCGVCAWLCYMEYLIQKEK